MVLSRDKEDPKLLDAVRLPLRTKHYSLRAEEACALQWLIGAKPPAGRDSVTKYPTQKNQFTEQISSAPVRPMIIAKMTSRYRMRTILGLLLAVACLSGCATVSSLPQVGGSPIRSDASTRNYTNSRIYQYPYQRVFASTRIVLKAWNFAIKRESLADHVILASGQTQAFSSGAVIGVYFTEVSSARTLVETIEKRKIATQIATKWHSSIILDGIEKQLKLEDNAKQ